MKTITLDARVVSALAGYADEALRLMEQRFDVHIAARGEQIRIWAEGPGAEGRVGQVAALLEQIAGLHARGVALQREDLKTAVGLVAMDPQAQLSDHFVDARVETAAKVVVPRSPNQRRYINAIREHDLVFGIGPAGTGKTYLAVAMAVSLFVQKKVKRIILARPAVEAGERLGFLPGDIAAKVDPYLRPLYDALYDMLEPDRTERLLEQGVIEVAPLAFMRGRTLNESFVILDEAQNSTSEQMKMFLTRIGFDSKAVVTGDVTQIDLPAQKISGLVEIGDVIGADERIDFVHFNEKDVVRHPLVQTIILAYERHAEQRRARHAAAEPTALPDDGRPR
jgi:phosphate starvation-inducible PhoH-like protein